MAARRAALTAGEPVAGFLGCRARTFEVIEDRGEGARACGVRCRICRKNQLGARDSRRRSNLKVPRGPRHGLALGAVFSLSERVKSEAAF